MGLARYLPALLITSFCFAADPLEETAKVDAEIEALTKATPLMQEVEKLYEQLQKVDATVAKEREAITDQITKLRESDAWAEYMAKRQVLDQKRNESANAERAAIGAAAKEIYAARHRELLSRALTEVPEARKLGFGVLNYPRVDGSTSTQPLAVILASRCLGVPYEWHYPAPSGYAMRRSVAEVAEAYFLPRAASAQFDATERYELQLAASRCLAKPGTDAAQQRTAQMINSLLATNSGTHESYEKLIAGQTDLILVARAASPDELQSAAGKGVKLELKPIAHDALVFIVNQKHDVKGMSLDDIRKLYRETYALTDPMVHKLPIIPLMRQRNSGSRELFDALVMKDNPLPDPQRPWQYEMYSNSMGGPYSRVTTQPKALGYSVFYYERFMAMSPFTRTIAIDGVEPSAETIANGKYPLASPVYAVWRDNEPADSPGRKLIGWLLSAEGQAVVRESGYVPARQ